MYLLESCKAVQYSIIFDFQFLLYFVFFFLVNEHRVKNSAYSTSNVLSTESNARVDASGAQVVTQCKAHTC